MTGQTELATHIGMAAVASRLGGSRNRCGKIRAVVICDRPTRCKAVGRFDFTTGISMKTGRTVTRFATRVQRIGTARDQKCMVRGLEALVDFLVTLLAFL